MDPLLDLLTQHDAQVFVSPKVDEGRAPITCVTHDLEDGAWQFLANDGLTNAEPRTRPMSWVIEQDPSVESLTDLPLGWVATRPDPQSPWEREASFPQDWNDLLTTAMETVQQSQARLSATFELERWPTSQLSFDDEGAAFAWRQDGQDKVVADVVLVGTLREGMWLWAWGDETIPEQARAELWAFERFGQVNGFEPMAAASWFAAEPDGWQMACLTAYLLGAEGVHRISAQGTLLFMILDGVERVD